MKYSKLANEFSNMKAIPLFEIELKNDEYLIVELSVKYKKSKKGTLYPAGLTFSFDNREQVAPYKPLPTYFDGTVKGKNGRYWLPFDECFYLDQHLETVYDNIMTGFIYPNNLQAEC